MRWPAAWRPRSVLFELPVFRDLFRGQYSFDQAVFFFVQGYVGLVTFVPRFLAGPQRFFLGDHFYQDRFDFSCLFFRQAELVSHTPEVMIRGRFDTARHLR